jgi:hypothetical protein
MDPVDHRLELDSSGEDSSAARDLWGCFAGDSLLVGTVAHLQ